MSTHSIGPERDAALGEALRAALDDGRDAAFAARVVAAVRREPAEAAWDVLAHWLRPGLAAAAALIIGLLAGLGVMGRTQERAVPLAEQLLAADDLPGGEAILARMWEGR